LVDRAKARLIRQLRVLEAPFDRRRRLAEADEALERGRLGRRTRTPADGEQRAVGAGLDDDVDRLVVAAHDAPTDGRRVPVEHEAALEIHRNRYSATASQRTGRR